MSKTYLGKLTFYIVVGKNLPTTKINAMLGSFGINISEFYNKIDTMLIKYTTNLKLKIKILVISKTNYNIKLKVLLTSTLLHNFKTSMDILNSIKSQQQFYPRKTIKEIIQIIKGTVQTFKN